MFFIEKMKEGKHYSELFKDTFVDGALTLFKNPYTINTIQPLGYNQVYFH